jgi:hypothetical protein
VGGNIHKGEGEGELVAWLGARVLKVKGPPWDVPLRDHDVARVSVVRVCVFVSVCMGYQRE